MTLERELALEVILVALHFDGDNENLRRVGLPVATRVLDSLVESGFVPAAYGAGEHK